MSASKVVNGYRECLDCGRMFAVRAGKSRCVECQKAYNNFYNVQWRRNLYHLPARIGRATAHFVGIAEWVQPGTEAYEDCLAVMGRYLESGAVIGTVSILYPPDGTVVSFRVGQREIERAVVQNQRMVRL